MYLESFFFISTSASVNPIRISYFLWHFVVVGSGNTVVKSMRVLKEHAVDEENVILLNLFCTPVAARTITAAFPRVTIYWLL